MLCFPSASVVHVCIHPFPSSSISLWTRLPLFPPGASILLITQMHHHKSRLLLPLNRSNNTPRMFPSPELEIPDPLPRPGSEFPVADRDGNAGAYQGGFDMCLFNNHFLASSSSSTSSSTATNNKTIQQSHRQHKKKRKVRSATQPHQ